MPPELPSIPTKPVDSAAEDSAAKIPADQVTPARIATTADIPQMKSDGTAAAPPFASPAMAEPQPAGPKTPEPTVQLATVTPAPTEVATPVARTEFGVDIGTANSIDGLRALWHGLSRTPALNGLRPIIVVRERSNGLGMQLRLVAGPLTDAAAAARICATLAEGKRTCETSVFDGQRLALKNDATRWSRLPLWRRLRLLPSRVPPSISAARRRSLNPFPPPSRSSVRNSLRLNRSMKHRRKPPNRHLRSRRCSALVESENLAFEAT